MAVCGTMSPRVVDTFRITKTECMGPRFREDDVERFVRIFLQASVIAARKFLRVSGSFRGTSLSKVREGGGTPEGAPCY